MCDALTGGGRGIVSPSPPRRKRLKIDEIDSQWHCAIIGTCLPLNELKSIVAKLAIAVEAGPSGYNLHASVVRLASSHHTVAKALTKMLNRRHIVALNRFSKIDTNAGLIELWAQALEKGDVAGAGWAVMSHPVASEDTRKLIFRDIHMLSHQMGATARADLRRLDRLEKDNAELESKIDHQQVYFMSEISRRDTENEGLRKLLADAGAKTRKSLHTAKTDSELRSLRTTIADLKIQLTDEIDRHRETENKRQALTGALALLDQRLAEIAFENGKLAEEIRLFETRLTDPLDRSDGERGGGWACAKLDLCGRCILFVGGRNQQMPHVRRLVEDCNGVFSHHDGGVEESMGRLHSLFGRADVVLFPVDCISHSAQDTVKQLCQRWQKPFVPVRRSGLGAYFAALETVATDA